MIEKILLWIDYGFLNYGVSKYLKKEFELYAIIDGINSTDNFFKNQKILWNFKKNDPHLIKIPEDEAIDVDTTNEFEFAQIVYSKKANNTTT